MTELYSEEKIQQIFANLVYSDEYILNFVNDQSIINPPSYEPFDIIVDYHNEMNKSQEIREYIDIINMANGRYKRSKLVTCMYVFMYNSLKELSLHEISLLSKKLQTFESDDNNYIFMKPVIGIFNTAAKKEYYRKYVLSDPSKKYIIFKDHLYDFTNHINITPPDVKDTPITLKYKKNICGLVTNRELITYFVLNDDLDGMISHFHFLKSENSYIPKLNKIANNLELSKKSAE